MGYMEFVACSIMQNGVMQLACVTILNGQVVGGIFQVVSRFSYITLCGSSGARYIIV